MTRASEWGRARAEVAALWPEIERCLEAGEPGTSIYKDLRRGGQLSCVRRTFTRHIGSLSAQAARQAQSGLERLSAARSQGRRDEAARPGSSREVRPDFVTEEDALAVLRGEKKGWN